jgi:Spy/CpxP family protein refolding chaperone
MTNKLTKIIAVLTVAGFVAAGPVAYAGSEGNAPEGGKGYRHGQGKEFFKELNLTPEQKETLKTQREAKKEEHKAAREQMKVKMRALHDAISKPETKRADVDGLVAEVNALKGQMFARQIDGVFAMKEVLTPEQFAKMQAKHQEGMNRKHEGWGKRHEGPEEDRPEPENE